MKKILFVMLLVFSCNTIFAQKAIKTLTEDLLSGKATYQYYEDPATGNYIKHGSFKYTENLKNSFGTFSASVTGHFVDGYRDGQWIFNIKSVDWGRDRGPYHTRTMNSLQTYTKGVPNGIWKITNLLKAREPVYQGNGNYVWSNYQTMNNETASATFRDGYTIGLTTSTKNGKTKSYTLPDDGMIRDVTILKDNGVFKFEIKYDELGICLGAIIRDKDGKVIMIPGQGYQMRDEITERMLDGARKYLRKDINEDELIDYGVQVSLSNASIGGVLDVFYMNNYFDSDKIIKGDKAIDEEIQRYDGKYYYIREYSPIPSSMHKAFPQNIHKLPEAEQIVLLGQFASKYGHQINDLDYINKMIVQLQSSIDEKQRSINEARMRQKTDSLLVTYNDQATTLYEQSQQELSAKLTSTNYYLSIALENYKKQVLNQFAQMKIIPDLYSNNKQVMDLKGYIKQIFLNDQQKLDLATDLNDELNNIYIPLTKEIEQIGELIPLVIESLGKISIKNSALNKLHQAMHAYLLSDLSAQTTSTGCIEALNNLKAYSNKIMEVASKNAKELRAILKTLKDSGSDKQRVEYLLK